MSHPHLSSTRRALLVTTGSVFLGLGALGTVLPGLPSTPFILLASACYVRSSDRLYGWMQRQPWLQPALRQAERFEQRRALPLSIKLIALTFAWGSLALTVLAGGQDALPGITVVFLAACAATVAMGVISTDGPGIDRGPRTTGRDGVLRTVHLPHHRGLRSAVRGRWVWYALAGAYGGLVWAVGARVIMRFVALLDGQAVMFNWRILTMMLVGIALVGVLPGLVYGLIRRWLPRETLWAGLAFGALCWAAVGLPLWFNDYVQRDIAVVGIEWRPLIAALFTPLFVVFGWAVAYAAQAGLAAPSSQ